MVRPSVLLAVALLLASLVAPVSGATGTSAQALDSSAPDGTLSYRLSLTPEERGEIEVTLTATMPDSVTRLRLDLDERQEAIEAKGFEADGPKEWLWVGRTDRPSLTYAVAAVAGTRLDGWLDRHVRADGQPTLPDDPAAFGRPDDRSDLDPGRVEFELRGTWTSDPEVVPSGVPVPVRYRSDEPVTLEAGANAIMLGDGTVELLGDPAEVVVRSAVDPDVTATASVPTSNDVDRDGLANAAELDRGTDLWNPDTDGDGLHDGQEVMRGTNPLLPDTDEDGLDDYNELTQHGTDPILVDTDEDGLDDGEEVNAYGTDPTLADTDEDGYADGREVKVGTDPTEPTSWWRFIVADLRYRFTAWLG